MELMDGSIFEQSVSSLLFGCNGDEGTSPEELIRPVALDETPHFPECDYDKNPTNLFKAIKAKKWFAVKHFLLSGSWRGEYKPSEQRVPPQVCTWVTKYETAVDGNGECGRWTQLPIHAALVFGAPDEVIRLLIKICPGSLRCADEQRMLPLHLAFRHGASDETIGRMLDVFPEAIGVRDFEGRTPVESALHGPHSKRCEIIDTIFKKHKNAWQKKEAQLEAKRKSQKEKITKVSESLKSKAEQVADLSVAKDLIKWREEKAKEVLLTLVSEVKDINSWYKHKDTKKARKADIIEDVSTKMASLQQVAEDLVAEAELHASQSPHRSKDGLFGYLSNHGTMTEVDGDNESATVNTAISRLSDYSKNVYMNHHIEFPEAQDQAISLTRSTSKQRTVSFTKSSSKQEPGLSITKSSSKQRSFSAFTPSSATNDIGSARQELHISKLSSVSREGSALAGRNDEVVKREEREPAPVDRVNEPASAVRRERSQRSQSSLPRDPRTVTEREIEIAVRWPSYDETEKAPKKGTAKTTNKKESSSGLPPRPAAAARRGHIHPDADVPSPEEGFEQWMQDDLASRMVSLIPVASEAELPGPTVATMSEPSPVGNKPTFKRPSFFKSIKKVTRRTRQLSAKGFLSRKGRKEENTTSAALEEEAKVASKGKEKIASAAQDEESKVANRTEEKVESTEQEKDSKVASRKEEKIASVECEKQSEAADRKEENGQVSRDDEKSREAEATTRNSLSKPPTVDPSPAKTETIDMRRQVSDLSTSSRKARNRISGATKEEPAKKETFGESPLSNSVPVNKSSGVPSLAEEVPSASADKGHDKSGTKSATGSLAEAKAATRAGLLDTTEEDGVSGTLAGERPMQASSEHVSSPKQDTTAVAQQEESKHPTQETIAQVADDVASGQEPLVSGIMAGAAIPDVSSMMANANIPDVSGMLASIANSAEAQVGEAFNGFLHDAQRHFLGSFSLMGPLLLTGGGTPQESKGPGLWQQHVQSKARENQERLEGKKTSVGLTKDNETTSPAGGGAGGKESSNTVPGIETSTSAATATSAMSTSAVSSSSSSSSSSTSSAASSTAPSATPDDVGTQQVAESGAASIAVGFTAGVNPGASGAVDPSVNASVTASYGTYTTDGGPDDLVIVTTKSFRKENGFLTPVRSLEIPEQAEDKTLETLSKDTTDQGSATAVFPTDTNNEIKSSANPVSEEAGEPTEHAFTLKPSQSEISKASSDFLFKSAQEDDDSEKACLLGIRDDLSPTLAPQAPSEISIASYSTIQRSGKLSQDEEGSRASGAIPTGIAKEKESRSLCSSDETGRRELECEPKDDVSSTKSNHKAGIVSTPDALKDDVSTRSNRTSTSKASRDASKDDSSTNSKRSNKSNRSTRSNRSKTLRDVVSKDDVSTKSASSTSRSKTKQPDTMPKDDASTISNQTSNILQDLLKDDVSIRSTRTAKSETSRDVPKKSAHEQTATVEQTLALLDLLAAGNGSPPAAATEWTKVPDAVDDGRDVATNVVDEVDGSDLEGKVGTQDLQLENKGDKSSADFGAAILVGGDGTIEMEMALPLKVIEEVEEEDSIQEEPVVQVKKEECKDEEADDEKQDANKEETTNEAPPAPENKDEKPIEEEAPAAPEPEVVADDPKPTPEEIKPEVRPEKRQSLRGAFKKRTSKKMSNKAKQSKTDQSAAINPAPYEKAVNKTRKHTLVRKKNSSKDAIGKSGNSTDEKSDTPLSKSEKANTRKAGFKSLLKQGRKKKVQPLAV